jgi:hypothetical protein
MADFNPVEADRLVDELHSIVSSMAFAPPEGVIAHQRRAASVLNQLGAALGMLPGPDGAPRAPGGESREAGELVEAVKPVSLLKTRFEALREVAQVRMVQAVDAAQSWTLVTSAEIARLSAEEAMFWERVRSWANGMAAVEVHHEYEERVPDEAEIVDAQLSRK